MNCLGCTAPLSAGGQRDSFNALVEDTLGDDCRYDTVLSIHEKLKRPDRITEGWAGTCSSDQIWGKTPLWRMRRRRWKTTVIWWTIRDHSRGKILSGCFQHHQYKKIRDQNPGCCSPRRSWTCRSCGNTRNWRTQVPCDPNGRRSWTERNPRTYRKWKSFWWRILWQYRYWDRGDIWWRIIVNSYFLTLTKPC
mgnify:CR=1 FL=1